MLWLNVENTGELLVIERDCMESIFLYISDFLSDDHFLEVNHRMLYLHVLVLKYFLSLLFVIILAEVFNGPCHVRVFVDHLLDNLLRRVVEISEMLLHMECFLVLSKRWQLRMRHELFEIAEILSLGASYVNIFLVLLGLKILIVVSLKEWINSLDVVVLQEFWEVKHHHLLVLNAIDLENILQH